MSATIEEPQVETPAATVAEPVKVRKAAPLPLEVTVTFKDGSPVVTSPDAPESDVPRDGDELENGDTFVRFDTKGETQTVQMIAQTATEREKSKIDFAAFNRAYRAFTVGVLQYAIIRRATGKLENLLADTMMNVRLAIILQNGDPDYWGKSYAYRVLFDDRIRGFLRDQGFGLDETNRLLDNVRTNYVRRNATVIKAAAVNETVRGTVAKQNGVKSAVVENVPNISTGETVPTVVITYDKTDAKTGENKVETWTPSDTKMPKPLANAIKAAAVRADGGKNGSTVKRLPEMVTGKPKTAATGNRANGSGDNERNYVSESQTATETWVACIGHVTPLELVSQLHEMASALSDYLIGAPKSKPGHDGIPGGPKSVGDALYPVAQLVLTTGANLAANGSKTDVAQWRYDTSDVAATATEETSAAPAAGETENDNQ